MLLSSSVLDRHMWYSMMSDKMIADLNEDTQNLLEKVKKELGQSISNNDVIKDALTCYYSDLLTINRAKRINPNK